MVVPIPSDLVPESVWRWDCDRGYRFACDLIPPRHVLAGGFSLLSLIVFTAFALVLLLTRNVVESPICPVCQGRLNHRRDCPERKK